MKRSQDHLTRNMMLDPVTQSENHIVENWKQVFNARNRDYESKYHQHDQLSRKKNITRRANVITRNDRNLSPPVVQCEMNNVESWKQVFNATNSTDGGEREYQQYHLSRKRRLDNADSQSRGSSTTRRMSNIFEQKNDPSMNDELLSESGRANINMFGKVKVAFNVCRISKHRDEKGRRKARITWRKLVYLLPYNEILFLQNRHAIQRLQEGLLGKEALTKGTANRHHWRDQITDRDIHLILENEY